MDGARGLGFLLVLASHIDPKHFMLFGIFGVAFFFTLSGYLITGQIVRETDLRRYYVRRLARIMPLAYLYLAINGIAAVLLGRSMDGYAYHFAFLSDWVLAAQAPAFAGGVVGHLWTIAVEVQFYMLWPLVLLAAGRHRVPVLAGLIVAALVWRLTNGDPYVRSITLPSRVDAFAAGGLIAITGFKAWKPLLVVGVGVLACVLVANWGVDYASPTAWAPIAGLLLTACIVVGAGGITALNVTAPRSIQWPPLVWCGERAYSLYIWHVPVLLAAEKLPLPLPVQVAVAIPAILTISWASHRWIEIALTDWINRHGAIKPRERAYVSSEINAA